MVVVAETVTHPEEWDEIICETVSKTVCNQCGADITGSANRIAHIKETNYGKSHQEWVEVPTGTEHKSEWVVDKAEYIHL